MNLCDKLNNIEDPKEMREKCTTEWFIPVAKNILQKNNDINCVCVASARYWNDQGDDETHILFVPSAHHYTSWKDLFDPEKNSIAKEELMSDYHDEYEEYKNHWHPFKFKSFEKEITGNNFWGMGDNEIFIQAFWACCKPDCDQEMPAQESYSPFIIVERSPKNTQEYKIRSIGDIIRIWT